MAKFISITNFLSAIKRLTTYSKPQPIIIGGVSVTITCDRWDRTRQVIIKSTQYGGRRKCERWAVPNSRIFCPRRWTRNRYWSREWDGIGPLW